MRKFHLIVEDGKRAWAPHKVLEGNTPMEAISNHYPNKVGVFKRRTIYSCEYALQEVYEIEGTSYLKPLRIGYIYRQGKIIREI